ncbi:Pam17-domain-containing protein [Annulohypoxylon maeteangense]|uniref:Pam17-domain-containing protein n=1 Tax=Annulohypoxylon maeteangense TaxID=1927788 RepID=UPI002008D9B0|nr:Pam17-domain-containing protein [Annulohypoxylon maeteangense]KAI0890663.1 Pam17-domain-containing protein [Annulohypoxylon maeteangense]
MLAPATTATRVGALGTRGLKLQVAFARGANGCPYSSLASSLAQRQQQCAAKPFPSTPVKTQSIARRPTPAGARMQCQFAAPRRHASTTTATSAGAPEPPSSTPPPPLDWNTFFRLRKTRRRFQLVSGLFTMAVGGSAGALLLVNMDMDWLLTKVPMDPFFALGIMTLSFAGLGWLAGPSLGSALFYTFKRGVKKPMAVKESEFFARIKKNRVDPSNSSLSGNAVPDFYGEKISSVAGYRQWLKDQRAFNKKRTSFV